MGKRKNKCKEICVTLATQPVYFSDDKWLVVRQQMYNLPVTKQQLDEQQWKQKKKKLKVETEKNKIKGTILKVLYILITDPFSG